MNILITGVIGAGKSSFIETLCTAFGTSRIHKGGVGGNIDHVTKELEPIKLKPWLGQDNIQLVDSWGFDTDPDDQADGTKKFPNYYNGDLLPYILDGTIPWFEDKINIEGKELETYLKTVQQSDRRRFLGVFVVLTHGVLRDQDALDCMKKYVGIITHQRYSPIIIVTHWERVPVDEKDNTIQLLADELALPKSRIFPIVNYTIQSKNFTMDLQVLKIMGAMLSQCYNKLERIQSELDYRREEQFDRLAGLQRIPPAVPHDQTPDDPVACPQCGSIFLDDVQFCPRDGTPKPIPCDVEVVCPKCSTPFVGGAQFCPRDGTPKPTPRDVEVVCPKCSTPFVGDARFCPRDGTPRPIPCDVEVVCPKCSTPFVGDARFCPRDGTPKPTPRDVEVVCPKCSTPFVGDARFCPRDGTPRPDAVPPDILCPECSSPFGAAAFCPNDGTAKTKVGMSIPSPAVDVCPKCSSSFSGHIFCPNDGTKLQRPEGEKPI